LSDENLLRARRFAADHFLSSDPATSRALRSGRASKDAPALFGILPRDLSYARQLPQLCASADVRSLFRGADSGTARPSAFVWSAPDGSTVAAAEWQKNVFDRGRPLEERDVASCLRRAREKRSRPDVLVALDADSNDVLRRDLAVAQRYGSLLDPLRARLFAAFAHNTSH
jgi:hypothetical protein